LYKRKSKPYALIDQAALCSCAFLLLLLYLSMARPKSPDPLNIDLPAASGYVCNIDGSGDAIIWIGKGKVMLELDKQLRADALIGISKKYKIQFSQAKLARFNDVDLIGVPVDQLKQYIAGYHIENKAFFNQAGIKLVLGENELSNWMAAATNAGSLLNRRI